MEITVLVENKQYMFTVFERHEYFYMTVVAGGSAMYNVTITLSPEEAMSFQGDENKAIATAMDLITRTSAYEARLVTPPLDPE